MKKKRSQPKLPKGQLLSDYSESIEEENNNPEIIKGLPVDEKKIIEPNEIIDPQELFGNENGQTESSTIKALFDPKNPKIKTELTANEIDIISRLYILSDEIYEPRQIFMLKNVLDQFVLLRISKDRSSRKEFVEANKDIKNKTSGNFFNQLLGQGQQ